ncbi:WD and tetratricopeptide repeats 1 [Arctopsyche grandis]|uniref:WD and tetratricopeptide repeats 1 n=1 Tax=Arctopsyche grandis TaxID=121162 RepID=UPI00406D78D1
MVGVGVGVGVGAGVGAGAGGVPDNLVSVRCLLHRETLGATRRLQRRLHFTTHLVSRLGLETDLKGHYGCVNCLEWNTDGTILASASDDLRIILWDPFRYKTKNIITTGHNGNIFSVKFITPHVLATCAADFTVRVQVVGEPRDNTYIGSECSCHYGRVKRLTTTPECPNLVWSAGEDGLILQHDIRTSHTCKSDSPIVLVNLLNQVGRYAEAKCLAINPRRPEQLAVGANDFYVRLYDRRMIKLSKLQNSSSPSENPTMSGLERNLFCRSSQMDTDNNIPRGCVQYFAPGHLSTQDNDSTHQKKATTYLTFSSDGNELLVNLGSEQVYLFDINTNRRATLLESFIIQHNHSYEKIMANNTNGFNAAGNSDVGKPEVETKNGTVSTDANVSKEYILPKNVKDIKEKANKEVHDNNYTAAVHLYNQAISLCSDCAVLYSNRAAALMRRNWAGDVYAAIRDCYTAIHYDPYHVKSHFRLAKALMELKKAKEAHECLIYFKDKFPKQANAHAVWLLQKDINLALNNLESSAFADEQNDYDLEPVSQSERQLRVSSNDYCHRYLGHCNTTTDIKEANFLGQDSQFIVAGSDDGYFFIWSRQTGNIIRCLKGDESIVNCIQVHPTMCLIATSGIESIVRLWSPRPEDGGAEPREILDVADAAIANQQRMQADPFEAMLLNITYQGGGNVRGSREGGPGARSGSPERDPPIACRTS